MDRSISLHPLSLVLGFVFGAVCLLSMGQVGVTKEVWPPARTDIVYVFEPAASVSIPAGGSYVVYAVPSDRWLTVTGTEALASNLGPPFWAEDLGGNLTKKGTPDSVSGGGLPFETCLYSPQGCGGAVGWTFRPGSNVVIYNPSASSQTLTRWALIGYLSRT